MSHQFKPVVSRRAILRATGAGAALAIIPLAASASTSTLASIARAFLAGRADRVTSNAGTRTVIPMTSAMRSRFDTAVDKLQSNRQLVSDLHGGYSRANTDVVITSSSISTLSATIKVRESTALYFSFRNPGAPASTAYVAEHEFDFVRVSGSWHISAVRYQCPNAHSIPITQFEDEIPSHLIPRPAALSSMSISGESRSAGFTDSGRAGSAEPAIASSTASYNYDSIISYAVRWYDGYNSAYPRWNDDCTNFVSQCLRAGGWATVGSYPSDSRTDNRKWWYGSYTTTSSYSWSASENWHQFALGSGRTYILSGIGSLGHGDVLAYDFDHSGSKDHVQLCTAVSSTEKFMTQHSGGYRDRPLTEILNSSSTNKNAWYYAHRT